MYAPKQLSDRSKEIWREVDKEYAIDSGSKTMLLAALESLDRYYEAKAILDEEGISFKSPTGVTHIHPCCKVEQVSRDGFIKAWRALDLINIEPPREAM